MENSNKELDSIIYRSNIFNYDNKFISSVQERNLKLDIISSNSDYSQVPEFFRQKTKDQIKDILALHKDGSGDPDENHEQLLKSYSKTNFKRAKAVIKVLIEGLNKSINQLTRGENKRLNKGESMEVDTRKNLEVKKSEHSDSILYCLLFFDGLMMVNIDFVRILVSQAESLGIELSDLLTIFYSILDSSFIEETSKEIASHILCGIVTFTDPEKIYTTNEGLFTGLMQWTYDYCLLKERKRDSCLTSNFSLLLTYDNCVDYFVNTFEKKNNCFQILLGCLKENNLNIIYESLFCFWNISNNKQFNYLFESSVNKFLDFIIQVLRTHKVDKIARIGFYIIKNLLDSNICLEIVLDMKLMKTIDILLTHKWTDPTIKDLLNQTYEFLEKNYKSMNSFEKYTKEIDSGRLKQGSLHTATFWEDNYKAFETQNFEYIEKLVKIVKSPLQLTEHEIEMKCIACFDIGEFARCYPGGSTVLEHFGVKESLMLLIQNNNLELKNKALVCLQKIMMKNIKKS